MENHRKPEFTPEHAENGCTSLQYSTKTIFQIGKTSVVSGYENLTKNSIFIKSSASRYDIRNKIKKNTYKFNIFYIFGGFELLFFSKKAIF